MARFSGVDFYEIDSLLSEEERQIRDHVRGWVEDRAQSALVCGSPGRRWPQRPCSTTATRGQPGCNTPSRCWVSVWWAW